MKRKIALFALISAVALGSGIVYAKADHGMKNRTPPTEQQMQEKQAEHLNRLLSTVKASEEQKVKIKAIAEQHWQSLQAHRAQAQQLHQQMQALHDSKVAMDSDQAVALRKQMFEHREQSIAAHARMERDIRAQLNAEQIQTWDKARQERAKHGREGGPFKRHGGDFS